MRRAKLTLTGTLILLLAFAVSAFAKSPLETVQEEVGKVLDVLRDPTLQSESGRKTKEDRIWSIAQNLFDFDELSKRAMSRSWRELNAEQQREFTDLFSKLLSNVYMDRIVAYKDEKIVFDRETLKSDKYAEVESRIITSTGPVFMGYRLILENDGWKVYDVIIEGVSLTTNYRKQFAEILRTNTPEKLIEILREKVEKQ